MPQSVGLTSQAGVSTPVAFGVTLKCDGPAVSFRQGDFTMQFAGQGKPPLGIIFDSDMGARIDAALALALLYGFEGKGEARLTSVSVSKANLQAAAYCEAVGRFYAGATSPEVRFFFR